MNKFNFNFSYSTYEVYCKSQLEFYFMKLSGLPPSDKGITVYGDAGNSVHTAAEDGWNHKINTFDKHWHGYNIESQEGINGSKLNKQDYEQMYRTCVRFMNNIYFDQAKSELKIKKTFLA